MIKKYNDFLITWRNRRNYEFDYDVKLIDNNIHLIYKQKYQIDRHNRRIEG